MNGAHFKRLVPLKSLGIFLKCSVMCNVHWCMLLPLIIAADTGKVFVEMFKKLHLHRCRLHSICCVVGVGAESGELLVGKKEADIGGEHSCSNTQGNSAWLNIPAPLSPPRGGRGAHPKRQISLCSLDQHSCITPSQPQLRA